MLALDDLQVTFGTRRWHFDMQLETHGVYALLGRSGSGKSTLLNLIAGFLAPESGDIRWKDNSILALEPAERPVTTLFQQQNLFTHLTARQNIGLGIDPGLKIDATQEATISDVLKDVGLAGFEDKLPNTLSGGEQQRVALARSLVRKRPILLLDEPFSALDGTTRQEMIALLRSVIAGYRPCVIMVTHDDDDVAAMQAGRLRMQNDTLIHD